MIGSELLVSLNGWDFEDDYHEGPHQEAGVCQLLRLARAVMEDFERFVGLVLNRVSGASAYLEESGELSSIAVHHCKIQRTEVEVEGEVHQVLPWESQ